MALMSIYWLFDAVSLFTSWWASVGLSPVLLVLIIAGFVILGGRSAAMVSHPDLERVLLSFS